MPDLILHQYDASPFSEKVRLLLGYKKLAWRKVDIPVIMPKPDLMPLTGGYRKTPVAQIGADIYCDSAIICRLIEHLAPQNPVYPAAQLAAAVAAAHWTDTFFFRVAVAVAFQPKALQNNPLFQDQEAAAAFMADRAQLSEGSTQLQMDFATAEPYFVAHLRRLDVQLAETEFVGGSSPTIVDFSTYHCLWFIQNSEALRDIFNPFSHVVRWLAKMASFGHGNVTDMTGAEALAQAAAASPEDVEKASTSEVDGLALGDQVEVMPVDYGFQPTAGTLRLSSLEELVVQRTDEKVGELAVHFPRLGFQVSKR